MTEIRDEEDNAPDGPETLKRTYTDTRLSSNFMI